MATENGISVAILSSAEPRPLVAGFERVLALITIGLTFLLGAYKVLLTGRLNVNWDEFFFLNHVYALKRNELTFVLQSAYTHLFRWLTRLPGNEIDQISAGRLVMRHSFGPEGYRSNAVSVARCGTHDCRSAV